MEIDETYYLKHYGVQGMKWGVRRATNKENVSRLREKGLSKRAAKNTNRYQNNVDKQRMAATGRNGKVSVLKQLRNISTSNAMLSLGTVARHPLSTKKAAAEQLKKNEVTQQMILDGKKRVTATLLKMQGISIADIDYSTS